MDHNLPPRPKHVCAYFYKYGTCTNGINCMYKHTRPQSSNFNISRFERYYYPSSYKTRLCTRWRDHTTRPCPYAYMCTFAHGEEELLPHPYLIGSNFHRNLLNAPNTQYASASAQNNVSVTMPVFPVHTSNPNRSSESEKPKKTLCHQFVDYNFCESGENCEFCHSLPAWNVCTRFYKEGQCSKGNTCKFKHEIYSDDKPSVQVRPPTLFKTQLCRYWKYRVDCPDDRYCCDAHGEGELQRFQYPTRNPLNVPRTDTSASASASDSSNTGNQAFVENVARGPRLLRPCAEEFNPLNVPRTDTSASASASASPSSNIGNQAFVENVARGPRLLRPCAEEFNTLNVPRTDTSASASASPSSNTGNQAFVENVARAPRLLRPCAEEFDPLNVPTTDTSASASASASSNTGNQAFVENVARPPAY